jgi:hypothetical protein
MNRSTLACACTAAVLALSASTPTGAERPRFLVLDVNPDPLRFVPSLGIDGQDVHGTVAINNWGQIVYARDHDPDLLVEEYHGWAYLPEQAFGQGGTTPVVIVLPDSGESAAWDINMSGAIVGQIDGGERGDGEAVVWQLGSTICSRRLGFLSPPPGDPPFEDPWSVAYAIRGTLIAGDALKDEETDPCEVSELAFKLSYTGCPPQTIPTMVELLPADFDRITCARAIGQIHTKIPPVVVGYSLPGTPTGICLSTCSSSNDALLWNLTPQKLPVDVTVAPNGQRARGMNSDDKIVGMGFENQFCDSVALYWGTHNTAPIALVPPNPNHTARAETINNRDPLQAVGGTTETGAFRALLWEQDGSGNWNGGIDLNTVIDPDSDWILETATDINEEGCIVGTGRRAGGERVFMLYESSCPDCTGDGIININDVLAVIAGWGQPGPCDFNDNGAVDINDFLLVIQIFKPCCRVGSTAPPA